MLWRLINPPDGMTATENSRLDTVTDSCRCPCHRRLQLSSGPGPLDAAAAFRGPHPMEFRMSPNIQDPRSAPVSQAPDKSSCWRQWSWVRCEGSGNHRLRITSTAPDIPSPKKIGSRGQFEIRHVEDHRGAAGRTVCSRKHATELARRRRTGRPEWERRARRP